MAFYDDFENLKMVSEARVSASGSNRAAIRQPGEPGAVAAAEQSSLALPRSAPEAQSVSSAAILDFIQAADRQVTEMNSFMLVRHGLVVAGNRWEERALGEDNRSRTLSYVLVVTVVEL